jgi:hypothetical protein
MKPFSAWLAMNRVRPARYPSEEYHLFTNVMSARRQSARNAKPQRVLIVEDTPENRRKLGMEEG